MTNMDIVTLPNLIDLEIGDVKLEHLDGNCFKMEFIPKTVYILDTSKLNQLSPEQFMSFLRTDIEHTLYKTLSKRYENGRQKD